MSDSLDLSSGAISACSSGIDDENETLRVATQKYRIRLHAANLTIPNNNRRLLLFRTEPDTFAVVSSKASTATDSIAASAAGTTTTSTPNGHIPKPSRYNVRETSSASATSSTASASVIWGQTEVVYRTRNPLYANAVTLDYATGSNTYFYVHIFQHNPGSKKEHLSSFGTAVFQVPDLLSMKNLTRAKRLRSGGCLYCRLEPIRDSSNLSRTIRMQMQATLVPSRKTSSLFARKPSTLLEISKRTSGGWIVVHRSEPVLGSMTPLFDPVQMDLETLCGSEMDLHLRLSVWAVRKSKHKRALIGISETTLRNLLRNREHALDEDDDDDEKDDNDLWNDAATDIEELKPVAELLLQKNSNKTKEVGRLRLLKVTLSSEDGSEYMIPEPDVGSHRTVVEIVDLSKLAALSPPTPATGVLPDHNYTIPLRSFSSYVEQGCQIDVCVAIDFTSSNGDPKLIESYHHQGDDSLNDYEETMVGIGKALCQYSESQEYVVWGFGAKYNGSVRHIFQCGPTPTVIGVDGVLSAYKAVFQSPLIMSGPTNFVPTIQAAAVRAKRNHEVMREKQKRYTVLLIITDGSMNNFEETQTRLEIYSGLPLSIVFVGVGRSDFRAMYELCHSRCTSVRRTTTFVEFRRHQHNPVALSEAALQDVPLQLCEYMQLQGI
jgi:Copine